MKNEEETKKTVSDRVPEFQKEAANVLMQHFSRHPHSVLVVSFGEDGIRASASMFGNAAAILMAREFAIKTANEAFENALMNSKLANDESKKQAAQESKPESHNPPGDTL